MNIITKNLDKGKVSGSVPINLSIETQPSISTPVFRHSSLASATRPRNFSAVNKFVKRQHRDSETYRARTAKKNEMAMALQKLGMTEEAEKLGRCCQTFQALYCPDENIVWRRFRDYVCNLPFCPDCWDVKSTRELNRILPKFLSVVRANPKLKIMQLTLTIPTKVGRSKKQGQIELKKAYLNLRRRKVFKTNVVAGVPRIENTLSNGDFHPHIHATLLVDGHLSEQAVRDNWFKLTSAHQIRLREINNAEDALVGTLVYPFKPADLMMASAEQVAELIASKGDKLGWSHGEIYGLDADDSVAPELNDPYADFIAETKKLRAGDACPSCSAKLVTGKFRRHDLINLMASAKIVGTVQPKCRGH